LAWRGNVSLLLFSHRSLEIPALESTLSPKFKGSCMWRSARPDSGETGQVRLRPWSSGPRVQVAQAKTTGAKIVGAKRLASQDVSGSHQCPLPQQLCLSGNPCEFGDEKSITGRVDLKQTLHTKIFTHVYLLHYRHLLTVC